MCFASSQSSNTFSYVFVVCPFALWNMWVFEVYIFFLLGFHVLATRIKCTMFCSTHLHLFAILLCFVCVFARCKKNGVTWSSIWFIFKFDYQVVVLLLMVCFDGLNPIPNASITTNVPNEDLEKKKGLILKLQLRSLHLH